MYAVREIEQFFGVLPADGGVIASGAMSAYARVTAIVVALTLFAACKDRSRIDTRAVIPLVPGAHAETAGTDAGRARASNAPLTHRAVRYIADRPAPTGALGVRWGMTRAEVAALHTAATIECRDSGEYVFCRRALVEVPVQGVVTYEFCGAALCAVSIDGPSTRDEAALSTQFDSLVAMTRRAIGDPSDEGRSMGAGCAGHLALCLASKQAEMSAHWTWRDGPQVQVSVDQDEEDAFKALAAVTWFSAERARRQDPSEGAPMTPDAGAHTDAR